MLVGAPLHGGVDGPAGNRVFARHQFHLEG
jgi:hypothetical protein